MKKLPIESPFYISDHALGTLRVSLFGYFSKTKDIHDTTNDGQFLRCNYDVLASMTCFTFNRLSSIKVRFRNNAIESNQSLFFAYRYCFSLSGTSQRNHEYVALESAPVP